MRLFASMRKICIGCRQAGRQVENLGFSIFFCICLKCNQLGWKWSVDLSTSEKLIGTGENKIIKKLFCPGNLNRRKIKEKQIKQFQLEWGPRQLSGFVCAFHSAVPGSNPKHAIYAFSIYSSLLYYICPCNEKRTKINKKVQGLARL